MPNLVCFSGDCYRTQIKHCFENCRCNSDDYPRLRNERAVAKLIVIWARMLIVIIMMPLLLCDFLLVELTAISSLEVGLWGVFFLAI